MPKFRKKPVVVEAVQAVEGRMSLLPGVWHDGDRQAWVIRTLEGVMEVKAGDWVITGVKGERYPCRDDIFRATYEPVETVQLPPLPSPMPANRQSWECIRCHRINAPHVDVCDCWTGEVA